MRQTYYLRRVLRGAYRAVADPRRPKVFAIGFHKTATTSLHEAFLHLGLQSYHGTGWRDGTRRLLFHAYDAFSDGPPRDFADLDRRFPGSKFILNTRDLDEWVLSRLKHGERHGDPETGEPIWDLSEAAVGRWLRRRTEYHLSVLRYFEERPRDLLAVNFIRDPDAAGKIARFLGHDTQMPRVHANQAPSKSSDDKFRALLESAARAQGVDASEFRNDLLNTAFLGSEDLHFPKDTDDVKG